MHPKLLLPTNKFFGLHPVEGDVGIEIELEGDNLPRRVQGWEAKKDNSLRGRGGRKISPDDPQPVTDLPLEYVTRGAVKLSDVPTLLVNLAQSMDGGAEIRTGSRTSTHIHVNMHHETVRSVFGYMLVHAIIEPVLLRLCGPDRNGNLFCMPMSETFDLSTAVLPAWVHAINDYGSSEYMIKRGKYACLNTDPLHTFGSVEVRAFPASVDPKQIMEWVTWATNVRTLAREWPDETYATLLDQAYNTPEAILNPIFGNKPLMSVTHPDNVADLVRAGVETAYEMWRSLAPLLLHKGPVKKTAPEKKKKLFVPQPEDLAFLDEEPPESPYVQVGSTITFDPYPELEEDDE
jgi:hypothetical protein